MEQNALLSILTLSWLTDLLIAEKSQKIQALPHVLCSYISWTVIYIIAGY